MPSHPPFSTPPAGPVAVIGAGLSGLTAAHTLHRHGVAVAVFDKGRGVGGRMSRRRAEDFHFDHGAQYFTVRSKAFQRAVTGWMTAGLVQRWPLRLATLEQGRTALKESTLDRYVGVPGMNALPKHLAEALDVRVQTRVEQVARRGDQWQLTADDGTDLGRYPTVLVTVPPPQAVPLLADAPALAAAAEQITMEPCWAALLAFDAPLNLPFDGAFVYESALSWVACNGSKPGRDGAATWVLHATPVWSRRHLEDPPAVILNTLRTAFFRDTGHPPAVPRLAQVHRWRFAMAQTALSAGCLWDDQQRIGLCGDWCHGSRVEGAYLSGLRAAHQLLGRPTATD